MCFTQELDQNCPGRPLPKFSVLEAALLNQCMAGRQSVPVGFHWATDGAAEKAAVMGAKKVSFNNWVSASCSAPHVCTMDLYKYDPENKQRFIRNRWASLSLCVCLCHQKTCMIQTRTHDKMHHHIGLCFSGFRAGTTHWERGPFSSGTQKYNGNT